MRYCPRMSVTDSLLFSELAEGPDFSLEEKLYRDSSRAIAGVDDAGRGPLAGPVVAAAVILDPDNIPVGLNDSKQLSQTSRETLFVDILKTSHVAWASVSAGVIDQVNIREASLLAMTRAVDCLALPADAALIDGRDVPEGLAKIGTALVKGDARSVSISAASIIAKVVRDRMMIKSGMQFPQYGFERHKGYGSKQHREAIISHGPCPLHRMTFAPLKGYG